MPELLSVARHERVALITLERPEKRNALSIELRTELAGALAAAASDAELRCLVLTGAGPAFCAGMDVTEFGGDREHKRRLVETSERLFEAVAFCPKPIVAAVNGPALAGGFALALFCDVRLASRAASFGFPEVGRHIPPSYAAASAALAPAVARELCLTGRIVAAEEALRLGIASELCEPDAVLGRALALATGMAAVPERALAEVKRRFLLGGQAGWARLLEHEREVLRAALLGE